jgi:DeoR/GlpR family transcriptional regulator of sugar metabolism
MDFGRIVKTSAELGREEEILPLLVDNPDLSVSEMGRLLDVSEVTVRKALDRLEAKGVIIRSRGKASPRKPPRYYRETNLNGGTEKPHCQGSRDIDL